VAVGAGIMTNLNVHVAHALLKKPCTCGTAAPGCAKGTFIGSQDHGPILMLTSHLKK
jgi:hypothetical protein